MSFTTCILVCYLQLVSEYVISTRIQVCHLEVRTRIRVCYLQLVSEYVIYKSYPSMLFTTRIRVLK